MKMKDLALAQVRRGERFTIDGVEFVKLEDDMDAAFAVAADTLPECCQFEDDGGMWQQTAKASITAYFEDKLAQEVKDGKIVVMM